MPPSQPRCNHDAENKQFKCCKLTMLDIHKFHEEFYRTKNKKDQDAFLLKHCRVSKVKRRRPRVGQRQPTQYITKLFVRKRNSVQLIRVCQKAFIKILGITEHRIRKVSRTFVCTGSVVQEKRGGDHTSAKNIQKLSAVKRFIESFKCLESHYCRSTVLRKYLPSTLNIRKMWRMYNEINELQVRECYFRSIFNRFYNLGFGSPRTDTCSKCNELLERIKKSTDPSEKVNLMTEKRVHMLKARAFYRLLKEKRDDLVTFSFDCQKNQVLPKISDQVAYYSRQLYIYNFGIVKSVPENTLNRNNVTLYTWTEDKYRKGANEIASAVYNTLQNTVYDENVKIIRLVADGCGAQNKNSIMIGMCAKWLTQAPLHIKTVELVFPIPGHSFIPPDRVFGLVEKEIKRMETILKPEEYVEVFEKYGTVMLLNNVKDWKTALGNVIRPPGNWHFQFNQCKRFFLRRSRSNDVYVKGEPNYCADIGSYKSILKRRKTFIDLNPDSIEKHKTVVVKKDKIKDVDALLKKHCGENWKSRVDLDFYKQVILRAENESNETEESEEEVCEVAVPESDLRI